MAESILPYLNGPDRPRLHAAGALCLHGQPFGFTQEDVTALNDGHDAIYTVHGDRCISSDNCNCYEYAATLKSLAARIAALLPEAS